MFDVFELQKKLVAAAGPSGSEQGIAALLAELAKPFVDEVTIDPLYNVICRKKGPGKKIMMAGHLDAIGFMVTCVDEKGFVWFAPLGGHSPALLINTRVRFLNGTMGIIRPRKAPKMAEKGIAEIKIGDLFIDIGAKDQGEAQSLVNVGDVAVFEGVPEKIAGNNVQGPYADDLIACTILLMVMEQVKDSPNDLYFVFTSQEEIGCVGSGTAAFAIHPDFGIACDVTSTGDTPADKEDHMVVKLGKGPAIKIKDASVICSPTLNQHLRKVAKEQDIAYQDEILLFGGTDTSKMQRVHSGVPATCISIPTRNIHSAVEMFNINDVEQAAKLMTAAISVAL